MKDNTPSYLRSTTYEAKKTEPVLDSAPPQDEDDLGYCVGRVTSKFGGHALGVKRNGKKDRIFEFSHLATSYEGDNERLDLVFAGNEKWVVIVHGRSLLKLLYFIKERKIDWIREAIRDVGQNEPGKPFITKIDFHEVKEEDE